MVDQCTKFTSRGLIADFVGEAETDKSIITKVFEGQVKLLLRQKIL